MLAVAGIVVGLAFMWILTEVISFLIDIFE